MVISAVGPENTGKGIINFGEQIGQLGGNIMGVLNNPVTPTPFPVTQGEGITQTTIAPADVTGVKQNILTLSSSAQNITSDSTPKGSKGATEYDKHIQKHQEAQNKLKDLENKLANTKGPKKQGPIKKQIEQLKKDIKGHEKEIKQKWPEGRTE
jgi:hypothetical protein